MTETWVPVLTAVISTVGASVSVWQGSRLMRADRVAAADDLATRFREPLLQAVFNLQSRIYNMLELGFLGRFLGAGSREDEREYAIANTLYVFAQYFCWVEILRRESQFVDPRSTERNRRVAHSLEAVRDVFADSITIVDPAFRLFRGEQRALGEIMLLPAISSQAGAPSWECMGYSAFVEALDEESTQRWVRRLREDIVAAAHGGLDHHERLRAVQSALVDIIDAVDPDELRIPRHLRHRLAAAPMPAPSRRVGEEVFDAG